MEIFRKKSLPTFAMVQRMVSRCFNIILDCSESFGPVQAFPLAALLTILLGTLSGASCWRPGLLTKIVSLRRLGDCDDNNVVPFIRTQTFLGTKNYVWQCDMHGFWVRCFKLRIYLKWKNSVFIMYLWLGGCTYSVCIQYIQSAPDMVDFLQASWSPHILKMLSFCHSITKKKQTKLKTNLWKDCWPGQRYGTQGCCKRWWPWHWSCCGIVCKTLMLAELCSLNPLTRKQRRSHISEPCMAKQLLTTSSGIPRCAQWCTLASSLCWAHEGAFDSVGLKALTRPVCIVTVRYGYGVGIVVSICHMFILCFVAKKCQKVNTFFLDVPLITCHVDGPDRQFIFKKTTCVPSQR